MFGKLFALFALVAVAFASPKPDPQVVYSSYPAVAGVPSYAAPYSPVVSAYSAPAVVAAPAAVPYAYGGYLLR